MRISITAYIITFLAISAHSKILAQETKESLSFQDVRQWREHSVTLSENGEWYTKLYNLSDATESQKDSITAQKINSYFQKDNQTDVLYICNSKKDLKYEIPNGKSPVFSAASEWIAYQIKSETKKNKEDREKENAYIELKHLASGFTVTYESSATYQFLEEKNYFITVDENSLLIYDLDNRKEHYIGNIGEFLIDEKSNDIAYTIASEDKRGNGIYLFNPENMTTKALETGSFIYSNLSWNHDKNALVAYKYTTIENEPDHLNMDIILIDKITSENTTIVKYPVKDIAGMPENMGPAVKKSSSKITWSASGDRLYLKIREYNSKRESEKESDDPVEKPTVQIWHSQDKKLLSQRIVESERKRDKVFDALFFRNTNKIVPLTSETIQYVSRSEGADNWAIGYDNRAYLSDWDIGKYDIYKINLKTGDKKLIEKAYSSHLSISPDAKKVTLWDGKDFWYYNLDTDTRNNITENLDVSFVNKEYDRNGPTPNYGFVAWVKDKNAVIVNHKLDLWFLPLEDKLKAKNLTASVTSKDSIRFRLQDVSFYHDKEMEKRYIDLSLPITLSAFNTQTKHAGYYKLHGNKLKELIYKPASVNLIKKSKKSDAIIYRMGDYENYPETYLSDTDFSKPKIITETNPQQQHFKWGKRILIHYTNDDGVVLQGILSVPNTYKKGDKLPMIVHSYEKMSDNLYGHVAPYLSGAITTEMLYVSDNYLFLRPDIHFNVGTPHSDMHECIDAAIKKVIELGYVDEQRIGYDGFSYGGHCGMYVATQENKFSAIAAGAGISNLVQGFNLDIVQNGKSEQGYYMTGQGRLGTDPIADIDMYLSESPVFNAKTMNTPLLLYHGTDDKVVQWEHSFGFYNILRYLKKPVTFLSYLGEGHGFKKQTNRLDIQMRLKDFFDHYLKGKEKKNWMEKEFEYHPEEKSKDKNKSKLPNWK